MPFKTFNIGDILTASTPRTRAVIVCTSGTRPGVPAEGMTIYETDTDNMVTYDGTGWRRYNARPLTATVATSEGTATTSYTDLATSGPAITSGRPAASPPARRAAPRGRRTRNT